jgi:hypothetical protein
LEEGVQRKFVERLGLIGIFGISLTPGEVNKETSRGRFQKPLGEMRSETIKSGKRGPAQREGSGGEKRHSRNLRGVPNRKGGESTNPIGGTL